MVLHIETREIIEAPFSGTEPGPRSPARRLSVLKLATIFITCSIERAQADARMAFMSEQFPNNHLFC